MPKKNRLAILEKGHDCRDDEIRPPRGIQERNQFWVDHTERMAELCCCNMVTTDQVDATDYSQPYDCLEWDAEYYAGCTEYDMPGYGSLIRSARSIVKKLSASDSDRTIRHRQLRRIGAKEVF